jgi:hypothetical protein
MPINLKKIVFSTKEFFKTSKNSTMETSNIVADPENKELNSSNVNDQLSNVPLEPINGPFIGIATGRLVRPPEFCSIPNQLFKQLIKIFSTEFISK